MAVAVKICGVRTAEAALVAAEAGADMVGLMFAPSRRQIDAVTAREIVRALRSSPHGGHVMVVGVFVNETSEQMAALADDVGLDWIQLSGHEPLSVADALPVPAIKALRFDHDSSETDWLEQPASCDMLPVMIDAHVAGSFGGAGVTADWDAAAELAGQRPVLLAGGLNPTNVQTAIETVQPWGVDVSSGVETDGVKDHAKIRSFIQAAKTATRR
ncbi:MAG: Phosphoribosylanthranilate isomerase [uncultured Chloroflexia bacterium]|uniref:N-(5'-phosphoribosyl)anthranilate isomerase n=1 Tax=uncultured Chloroflexia bacterium TaxID=1672391 RepID=A0A6J4N6A3_9CHLR|nr:MAG: Phosphoribosylanthranilate isomerase [uncultured Chloroflexia bacterium]